MADHNDSGAPIGAVLATAGGGSFFGLIRRASSTASEFQTKRIRPAVVVSCKARRGLAVVIVINSDPEIPVSRQVEVQIEGITDSVPAGDCQAGIESKSGDQVSNFQLFGVELSADICLC